MYNKIDYLAMIHDAILDRSEFLQTLKVLLVFVFSCMLLSHRNVCLFFILPTIGLWMIDAACTYRETLLRELFRDVDKRTVVNSVSMSVERYKSRVMSIFEIAISHKISFFYVTTCFTAIAKFIICR